MNTKNKNILFYQNGQKTENSYKQIIDLSWKWLGTASLHILFNNIILSLFLNPDNFFINQLV